MKKLEITHSEVTVQSLTKALKKSENESEYKRCLGLRMLLEGEKREVITRVLKLGQHTLRDWIERVNKFGLEALKIAKGRGRKRKTSKEIEKAISKSLEKSPRDCGYDQGIWTGALLRMHLEKEYEIVYKQSSVYVILNRLGFSLQRPTRLYGEADKEAQEAFKKNSKKS